MNSRVRFNTSSSPYHGHPPPRKGGAELLSFLNDPPDVQNQGSNDNSVGNIRNTRKERIISPNSSFSMSHSNDSDVGLLGPGRGKRERRNSRKGPVVSDPNFAPPPLFSNTSDQIKASYALNAEREANYKVLPKYELIRHSGHIMTRFSAVSLLTKKWSKNFWILYSSCLYFFRSKADFERWLFDPYLGKEERESLVKRYLDFNGPEAHLFKLDKIGLKYYRKGGMMHHFKLDKHYDRGPSVSLHLVAAFSSMNQNDVIELHTIFSIMLKNGNPTNSGAFSETYSAYSSTYSMTDGYNSVASAGF